MFAKNGSKDHGIKSTDFEKSIPVVKLQNRANVGIRAYTDTVYVNGVPIVFEIMEHAVLGRYLIQPYVEDNNRSLPESLWGLNKVEFKTFDSAKRYLENRFKVSIELDRESSNDYQTWEKNIKDADNELPFSRIFWHLPESER